MALQRQKAQVDQALTLAQPGSLRKGVSLSRDRRIDGMLGRIGTMPGVSVGDDGRLGIGRSERCDKRV